MASRDEVTLPATRPRSRKSMAPQSSAETADKENMTADIGALGRTQKRAVLGERPSKKSRSKSIGPGGLDALKDATGNRRKSITAPLPRSILKPTMPSLQDIPAHKSTKNASPGKAQQKTASSDTTSAHGAMEETQPVGLPSNFNRSSIPAPSPLDSKPAVTETKVMLRTEEQQQAASRERDEKEKVENEKDLKARREARRKSLANRRVSFAPEATLHTWDVVEYMQDSTTSSASTNSTRRASAMSSGTVGSPHARASEPPSSDPSEPPSTPPEQVEDTIAESPAHQRDLHQKKRRRSSGIPPLNFKNPDSDVFSSSPLSTGSVADDDVANQLFAGDEGDGNSDSDSDSDNEGTAMSLDVGDTTDMSMASVKSTASSTGSSARLEEALQLAARQAGTQGIEFDENGDDGGPEEEVLASFQPWSKVAGQQNFSPALDQENMNPFSPAFKSGIAAPSGDDAAEEGMTMEMTRAVGRIMPEDQSDEEMTMDMTIAIGNILKAPPTTSVSQRRRSVALGKRQGTRRRSSAESSSLGDETMDLTMAIGGIQHGRDANETRGNVIGDEDVTMEFTSGIGGVLVPGNNAVTKGQRRSSAGRRKSAQTRRQSSSTPDDETMDMTMAMGGILSAISDSNTNDQTTGLEMDMTTAFGGILPSQLSTGRRPHTRHVEQEVDKAELISSPFQALLRANPQQKILAATVASETGSPSLAAFRGKGLRRSGASRTSTTPRSTQRISTEESTSKNSPTPSKRQSTRATTATEAARTSPSDDSLKSPRTFDLNNRLGSSTPKGSPLKKSSTPNKLFQKDNNTGIAVPNIILTPQKRRSSGIGIDRIGLGSPHIAALLDRRRSIGDQAVAFISGDPSDLAFGVRFENPQRMEAELDREREEESSRENGRKIMEREADSGEAEKDATVNLKEMIQSLTPKKRPLNGRKSLHVGAAKGILGKRPAELDEDEQENDDEGGVKRLKNHQGSPVKNVKLSAPPSKAETTGRYTRAGRGSLQGTTGNISTPTTAISPLKDAAATTPKSQGRFRDVVSDTTAEIVVPFKENSPVENPILDETEFQDERIQLQDFLNMTSIRFMELTTTKRRHTVAPNTIPDGHGATAEDNGAIDDSLESCVVAGACTVPMLELFQHSCRELKNYISEGRSIVREIETETFEENPPLFREYMSATPDVRLLMDNQFKNVKTHARLLSKGMWYEWRMKLLDGLKDGLFRISEGMEFDAENLQHQQDLLDSILPALVSKYEKIAEEEADLRAVAQELASCDQRELSDARQKLISIEANIEAKKRLIDDYRMQIEEKERSIDSISKRKQVCLEDIDEAEKVREACRGWSANEGLALKAKVDDLEKQSGWAITGVSGSQVSMTFRKDIELVFDASSFKPNNRDAPLIQPMNSRIDLWYIAGNRELSPMPLTIEKDFFLQNIREHCRCLLQGQTTVKELLDAVSASWAAALAVVEDIRSLNRNCVTEVTKTSDSSISVRATLLLVPLSTKVDIYYNVHAHSNDNGLEVQVKPRCTVVYGERFNEAKMTEFLETRSQGQGEEKRSWADIATELEERLLARGRK